MSRTTRKHAVSFEKHYYWQENNTWLFMHFHDKEHAKKQRVRYYSDSNIKYDHSGIPKRYRKQVNRNRRNFDKRELYKSVNFEDYPEQCLDWNGKSNVHWCYY